MAATRRSIIGAGAALVLAMSGVCLTLGAQGAGALPTWSAANPPLPADALPAQGVTLLSSSCPVAGWCVAVGDYAAVTADATSPVTYEAGLIEYEAGGTWTAAQAPLPPGASAVDPQALLESVSCSAVGSCLAVGRYLDGTGATQGLVEELSGGTWSPSTSPLPAGASSTGDTAYAQLTSVSCPDTCAAVGVYSASGAGEQAYVVTGSGGAWSASAPALPQSTPGSQFLGLSCPSDGSCVATGTYLESGDYVGFVATQSGASWSTSDLVLPTGASPLASVANDDLSVSCPSAGSCAVAGTTFDGAYEGVLDSLSGGVWTAQSAPLPAGQSSTDVQLESVSCAQAGACEASGFAAVGGVSAGLFESLSGGTWSATAAPVPPGTLATTGIDAGRIACTTDGSCTSVGLADAAGTVSGLLWDLSSGTFSVTATPLPADANANPDPMFATPSCPAPGECIAVGTYIGSSAAREGVVETDPSLPATTTAVSMQPAAGGTAYSAVVTGTASVPTGTVVFSDGLTELCSATLVGSTATCVGPPPAGQVVVGSYSGDAASAPSWGSVANSETPTTMTMVAGSGQAAVIGTFFSAPLQVRVTDAAGAGVPGVAVTFTPPAKGASAVFWGSNVSVTDAAGVATSSIISADAKTGAYIVSATSPSLSGQSGFLLDNLKR